MVRDKNMEIIVKRREIRGKGKSDHQMDGIGGRAPKEERNFARIVLREANNVGKIDSYVSRGMNAQ